jgi:endonuclease-3 related protein
MDTELLNQVLPDIYQRLYKKYGPQHWWPADEPFEVIVGAILTQSTAWANVEKAISNLKQAGALTPDALRKLPQDELAALIHSCGYYNAKAIKLKGFAIWFGKYFGDSLEKLFAQDIGQLRQQLLGVFGIGPESADAILLYAGNKPVFVIDAYTQRIFGRIGIKPRHDEYQYWQAIFMKNLPADAVLFNEYHALLVRLAKEVCRQYPLCKECCLSPSDELVKQFPCSKLFKK